jgi:hypothetical protein
MTIEELITITRARLIYLSQQRETAVRLGDVEQTARVDQELSLTEETLTKLLHIA